MPSPGTEEGDEFWMKVIGKFQEEERAKGTIIYSFARFDIMKKMYEKKLIKKAHH